jgi:hypothetical protein
MAYQKRTTHAYVRPALKDKRGGLVRPRRAGDRTPNKLSAGRLYADILPANETPDMLNEAVRRWRHEHG